MSEQETTHKRILFDGAMEQIKELDTDWRVDSRAIKVQHANAVQQRDRYTSEVKRLEELSQDVSARHNTLRADLTKTALKLAIIDGEITNRADILLLAAQVAEGRWMEDKEIRSLAKNLATLDNAIDKNQPVVSMGEKAAKHVFVPNKTSGTLNLELATDGKSLSIEAPYENLVDDKEQFFANGSVTLYPEYIKDLKNTFIIGDEALHSFFREFGWSKRYSHRDDSQEKRNLAYDVWRKAVYLTGNFEEHGDRFVDESLDSVSSSIAKSIGGHIWRSGDLSFSSAMKPALKVINQQNKPQLLKESVLSSYYKTQSYISPKVVETLIDEIVDKAIR